VNDFHETKRYHEVILERVEKNALDIANLKSSTTEMDTKHSEKCSKLENQVEELNNELSSTKEEVKGLKKQQDEERSAHRELAILVTTIARKSGIKLDLV
jgi:molecular chaperone GrpE (heat shock protein)